MKRLSISLAAIVVLILLLGCAQLERTTLQEAYPKMYSHSPVTILILPPINNTTAADAGEYFSCSLSEALGLRGYYPLPVQAVFNILQEEGLYGIEGSFAGSRQTLYANLQKYFGVDAVLQSTIDKWDKSWFLTAGTLTVDSSFELYSTSTAECLWDYSVSTQVRLGSSSDNLLAAALESALKTAVEDYFPHARQANIVTFQRALPYGKYHPEAGTDGLNEIPALKYEIIQIDK